MDKYFRSLVAHGASHQELIDSGWVDNDDEQRFYDDTTRFAVTSNLSQVVTANRGPVNVLITTGCFAPIHQGHIDMLKVARDAVEKATGNPVVSAMISPDHQKYIQTKTGGYDIHERILLIEKAIADEPWIHVEKWGSLFVPYDVNFTTVYERFRNYLDRHTNGKNVKLWFVFGSDHMKYAHAFMEYGHGVCVSRGGYNSTVDDWETQVRGQARRRCVFAPATTIELSSTVIRGKKDLIKPRDGVLTSSNTSDECSYLLIRNDLENATGGLLGPSTVDDVARIISKYTPTGVTVKKHDIDSLDTVENKDNHQIISMDPFIRGDYRLDTSRVFSPLDGQVFSQVSSSRPESPSLDKQLSIIPKGEYVLVDDDIASGSTMARATQLLGTRGINVVKQVGLSNYQDSIWDFVDARDFICGTQYGGLVVSYGGKSFRVPYMFPYVNLSTRSKISPEKVIHLSKELWDYNMSLYKDCSDTLEDKNMSGMAVFGFDPLMPLNDFIEHNIRLCQQVIEHSFFR